MSLIKANGAGEVSTGFYNGVATQSLRLNGVAENTTLYRDLTATGNRRTATISFWMKNDRSDAVQYYWSKGDGGGVQTSFQLFTHSDSTFSVYAYNSDSQILNLRTNRVFRDASAWYHFVVAVDTTQATPSDRVKLYVNGVQETSFSTASYMSQNTDTVLGLFSSHKRERLGDYQPTYTVGSVTGGSAGNRVHGYFSDFYYIDGTAIDDADDDGYVDEFGELKNGVWIPKAYTGSYGTNGYRLEFKETGTGTASSTTIGADTSGNDNHWTTSNVSAEDSNISDCPENNMCTFNSVGRRYGQSYVATFSEGNLKATGGGNATHIWGSMAINQIASQGGVYFEVRLDSIDTARTYFGVIGDNGINNKNSGSNNASYSYPIKALINDDPYGYFGTGSGSTDLRTGNTAFSNGDVAGIAILSDGKFFCHRNGTYMKNASGNTGDPSTGTNELTTIDLTEGDWIPYVGYNSSFSINFGQDGTFGGNETPASTYTDSNGIGLFNYPVPTNCLAICSSNMEEPTIGPNADTQADDHFNISLYVGNATSGNTGSGLGFQPDWLMFKNRDTGDYWRVYDSTRGTEKSLAPNDNDAEVSSDGGVTSFTSPANDGFTMGSTSYVNRTGNDYVAWAWKANGGTTSTIAVDTYSTGVPSVASTVQANTDAGFSIVTFPANGTNGTKVGHGLGKAPKMIITKQRPAISSWYIYHDAIGKNKWVRWNNPNTEGERTTASTTIWGDTTPDSNTFTIGNSDTGYNNGGANDVVAYCFAEIEGYSKFGSFIGNGESTDGTFIYLGFRPRFFMMFLVSSASLHLWFVYDTKRGEGNQPINPEVYFSDQSYDQETGFVFGDFLSNGIKIRNGNSARNPAAGEFIYMAFAENPFKYANAR